MDKFIISPELYEALASVIKKNLIQEMRKTKSIASGDLLKSIKFDVQPTEDGAIVSIEANEYITYIDKGRKPGKYAPIKDLEKWVRAKGIETDKKKVTAVAFAINNKIKKQGIKPKPILEKAYSNGLPMYDKIISSSLDTYLNEYLNKELNKL